MRLIEISPKTAYCVEFNPKAEVLFSYGIPVGVYTSGKCYILEKGDERRSTTTAKHINKWVNGRDSIPVSYEKLSEVGGPFLPPPLD